MEQYKIYITNNYFTIQNIITGETQSALSRDVYIDKDNSQLSVYRIFNVPSWNSNNSLSIDQIFKQNGNADTSQIIRSCDTVGIKIYGLIPNANDPNLVLAKLPNGYRPIGFEGGIYCTGYGQNSLKP